MHESGAGRGGGSPPTPPPREKGSTHQDRHPQAHVSHGPECRHNRPARHEAPLPRALHSGLTRLRIDERDSMPAQGWVMGSGSARFPGVSARSDTVRPRPFAGARAPLCIATPRPQRCHVKVRASITFRPASGGDAPLIRRASSGCAGLRRTGLLQCREGPPKQRAFSGGVV